jgi:hypothetical protein
LATKKNSEGKEKVWGCDGEFDGNFGKPPLASKFSKRSSATNSYMPLIATAFDIDPT